MMYKYKIYEQNNETHYKSDPFEYFNELKPGTASKVYDINDYVWHNEKWIKNKSDIGFTHKYNVNACVKIGF